MGGSRAHLLLVVLIMLGIAVLVPMLQGVEDVIVRGVLGYQVCNDQVYFPPASVPLSWTVASALKA